MRPTSIFSIIQLSNSRVSHPHPQFVAAKSLIVLFLRDFLYTPSYDRLLATVSRFFYLYYFLQKGKVVIKSHL